MTREEKDIELIMQVIDTKRYDGIEYFHTYEGYYRLARGGQKQYFLRYGHR